MSEVKNVKPFESKLTPAPYYNSPPGGENINELEPIDETIARVAVTAPARKTVTQPGKSHTSGKAPTLKPGWVKPTK